MIIIKGIFLNIRGKSHIKSETPCQDKYFYLSRNGITAVALCDGAGSRELSHFGAEAVSRTVCELLCDDIRVSKEYMHLCIIEKLKELGENVGDFACTLLYVAYNEDDFVAGHIGDGVMGIYREDYELLSSPHNGLYKNETFFVTDSDALDNFRTYEGYMDDVNGFVLMTDGLADSLFNSTTNELSRSLKGLSDLIITESEKEASETFEQTVKTHIVPRTTDDISGIIILKWGCDKMHRPHKA